MRDSPSKGTALMAYTRFSLDRSTPSLWRVTFDNPPINLIDPVMIVALHDLLAEIEQRCALDASPNRSRQAHHPDIRPVDHLRDQDRPGVFPPSLVRDRTSRADQGGRWRNIRIGRQRNTSNF